MEVVAHPAAIGAPAGYPGFDFRILHDATFRRIHQEHAAGLQASFPQDVFRCDVQDARLRGHDHPIIACDRIAGGPQAVAVQHGAHHRAVREGNRSRSVPGFHETGVVGIEVLFIGRHAGVMLPGFGDEHHDAVGQ